MQTEFLICGAGIAGIATAYELAVTHGFRDIVLVDERPPLSLTSNKSTEAYRNWWPGPGEAMVALMNRSVDRLEALARAHGNFFNLNRRGYLYATADPTRIAEYERSAAESSALGAGPVRVHRDSLRHYQPHQAEGFDDSPGGADLFLNPALIREQFPYLSEQTVAVLHARRCGWFSADALGRYWLEQAKAHGVTLLNGRVTGIETTAGAVSGARVQSGPRELLISTQAFINAAGPYLPRLGSLLHDELPVFSELHLKLAFPDSQGIVPRNAPLLIWSDPQYVNWAADEREELAALDETRWLTEPFPAGIHLRPEGLGESTMLLMLWDYHHGAVEVVDEPALDEFYPELVLRGMMTMIPKLGAYLGRAPKPIVDGGYYTKTRENRPLIGPMRVPGAYVIGALSGYGIMAASAAAELLAAHVTGQPLPTYAAAFSPARYVDSVYLKLLEEWGSTGQL